MRSWIGLSSSLASVTMMVKLLIASPSALSFGSQCSQRPAKAVRPKGHKAPSQQRQAALQLILLEPNHGRFLRGRDVVTRPEVGHRRRELEEPPYRLRWRGEAVSSAHGLDIACCGYRPQLLTPRVS